MLSHGLGRTTVYDTIDGVVDVVNSCRDLAYNEGGALFPSDDEQMEIAD